MIKRDPFSGETFKQSRRNQIFASAQNRIDYHNLKASKTRSEKAIYFKPLDKNYTILTELLNPDDKKTFSVEFLLSKGFDLSLFTHVEDYLGKQCFAFCNFIFINTDDKTSRTIYRKK